MGLFSRPSKHGLSTVGSSQSQFDLRTVGIWTWYGESKRWSLDFNNKLGQLLRIKLDDFVLSLNEIRHGQSLTLTPTDGQRIEISGMYGFGDDYRWFAYIHGEDGRHYFFRKFDAALVQFKGASVPERRVEDIDEIPFESEGPVPGASTHQATTRGSSPDLMGKSQPPTVSIRDEDAAAIFASVADYESMDYEQLASLVLGGAVPWQEGVVAELRRRHQAEIFDVEAFDEAVKIYKKLVGEHKSAVEREVLRIVESKLRKAISLEFDPPGGWGALGAE